MYIYIYIYIILVYVSNNTLHSMFTLEVYTLVVAYSVFVLTDQVRSDQIKSLLEHVCWYRI